MKERLSVELVAVLSAVVDDGPAVLTADGGQRLPAGPLRTDHRSMQAGLSAWVEQQTGHSLGYVEQLYTFADPDREQGGGRIISVSYLGLTRTEGDGEWHGWYDYFPWEDRRPGPAGEPGPGCQLLDQVIEPALRDWVAQGSGDERSRRRLRADICYGLDAHDWVPDLVLQRYELLYEMGAIPEAHRDRASGPAEVSSFIPGVSMHGDHRRILATGLARLRAKIQYHPVIFELVPDEFTLGQLQTSVEALAGQPLHKQNFRRLVTAQNLVEETGGTSTQTGGRPARLYRFRRAVLDERLVAGTKLPRLR